MAAFAGSCLPPWLAAFGTSVLFHVFLFFGLCTLGWNAQLETYSAIMVDLLTPSATIAAISRESDTQIDGGQVNRQETSSRAPQEQSAEPLNEYRQETIQLNTHKPKYAEYNERIKRRIYAQWRYPEKAREGRLQGQLLLEFGILNSGDLAGIKVLKSSGHPALDHGTIDAINACHPFPPLPAHFDLDRLNIRARFFYRLVTEGHG